MTAQRALDAAFPPLEKGFFYHRDAIELAVLLSMSCVGIARAVTFWKPFSLSGPLHYRVPANKFEQETEKLNPERIAEVRESGGDYFDKAPDGTQIVLLQDGDDVNELYIAQETIENGKRYYDLIPVRLGGWRKWRQTMTVFLCTFICLIWGLLV